MLNGFVGQGSLNTNYFSVDFTVVLVLVFPAGGDGFLSEHADILRGWFGVGINM